MEKIEIRQIIKELAELNIKLDKRGGPEKSGKLFEIILQKEDELLEKLGLPSTPYYQGLLQFDSIPWDKEIDDLIELLYHEVEKRKKDTPSSELELLIEAKGTNRDPMFILPQLGIATHVYPLFVYNNILMYGQDSPENILAELKLVNNNELLDILGRMSVSTEWTENAEEKITSLEKRGLKYIRQYTMSIINNLKGLGFKINGF
jgi:hypothetical protein